MKLLTAQPHLGLGLIAEYKQPLFSREQRKTPRLALLMQRGLPVIQLAPASLQALVLTRQLRLGDRRVRVERMSERLRNLSLARDAAVQIEDKIVQPDPLEALQDGVDRGTLLGDEENRLAARDKARDEVADRLALAGARRPLDDEVLAAEHLVNRVILARVGIEHEELVGRRRVV